MRRIARNALPVLFLALSLPLALPASSARAESWPDPTAMLEACVTTCQDRAKPQVQPEVCMDGCVRARNAYKQFLALHSGPPTGPACGKAARKVRAETGHGAAGLVMGGMFYAAILDRRCP